MKCKLFYTVLILIILSASWILGSCDVLFYNMAKKSPPQGGWTAIFNLNDGSGEVHRIQLAPGENSIPEDMWPEDPTRPDHFFMVWNDGSGNEFIKAAQITRNITLWAHWLEIQPADEYFLVTFDKDNDDKDSFNASPRLMYVVHNTVIDEDDLPAPPVRTGFIFSGWFTSTGGGGSEFKAGSTVTTDIKVFAHWAAIIHTVTFNKNNNDPGSTDSIPSREYVTFPQITVNPLPAIIPDRDGYTFNGWNTQADGNGSIFNETTRVASNITVYAQWIADTFTVKFDKNGGDTEANPSTKTVTFPATTVGSMPLEPTRTGHIFTGWNTAAAGIGTAFITTTPVIADITVYARWDEVQTGSFTVIFNKNTTDPGSIDAVPHTMVVTPPADTIAHLPEADPVWPGYIFNGWTHDDNPFDDTTTVNGNITVYAQWSPYNYRVTFNKNNSDPGSTEADPLFIDVESPFVNVGSLPDPPSRTGHAFEGWNTNPAGTGDAFTADTVVTATITVHAKWRAPPGSGTIADPFLVYNVDTLKQVGTGTGAPPWNLSAHYEQIADIDMSGQSFTSIGGSSQFTGTYKGGGYVISNLSITVNNTNNTGLFAHIGSTGTVKNLGLMNISITANNSSDNIGGMAGRNNGTIENCYVSGSINGRDNVGGLVGNNDGGTIVKCYTAGSVEGRNHVGGVAGNNNVSGSLKHNVALNPYVRATLSTPLIGPTIPGLAGRVIGNTIIPPTLNRNIDNNHARRDMRVNGDLINFTISQTNLLQLFLNGYSIPSNSSFHNSAWWQAYPAPSFFTGIIFPTSSVGPGFESMHWNFDNITSPNLPALRNAGIPQNPQVVNP